MSRCNETTRFYDEKRSLMKQSFEYAMATMDLRYKEGDPYATEKYVWPNQVTDAQAILHMLYTMGLVFISVIKQPKLGCNGLMFELARLICTHNDDDKYIPPENVYYITGMSNKEWEYIIKKDCPPNLSKNVYHRNRIGGKSRDSLDITKLKGKQNLVLFIDEVDVATKATKKKQTIHRVLEAAGILDMEYMIKNNVRIITISATICKEWRAMNKFSQKYCGSYSMTVPKEYFGVEAMHNKGILKQSPKISSVSQMVKFLNFNIINYFEKNDPRVHIIRGTKKTHNEVLEACNRLGIQMYDHEHNSKLTHQELSDIFLKTTKHVVIFIKNMFGRADFIPNEFKKKIGVWFDKAVTEKSRNANVHLQAGIGRLSGFWRSIIENGHRMGYIYTNLKSVDEYIDFYKNPSLATVKCHNGQPVLQPKYIYNSEKYVRVEEEELLLPLTRGENSYRIYQTHNEVLEACKIMGYNPGKSLNYFKEDEDGFKMTTCEGFGYGVHPIKNVIKSIQGGKGQLKNNGKLTWRSKYPCYLDLNNSNTLVWVLLVHPGEEKTKLNYLDNKLPDKMNNW